MFASYQALQILMNKKCLHVLLCLLLLLAEGKAYADQSGNWKTAAVIDVQDPVEAAKWGEFEIYEFPGDSVGSYKGNRNVFFGNQLEFDVEGLPDGRECRVVGTFLSEKPRILTLDGNGTEFESRLVLEKGLPVTRSWVIPSSRLYGGKFSLTIRAASGPNAVLQKLEIQTADGQALRPGARRKFREATHEELENLVIPLPSVTLRPQTVSGVKIPMMSLNGTWEFSPEGTGTFRPIQVPGEWKMQGIDVPAKSFALYRRSFDVPEDWRGKRIKLRFDAVHAVCEAFVNGKKTGGHEGGFVPFELDITPAVSFGKKNVLEVRVQSESVADSVSCISQYASHQVGGIIRKVTLFAVPEVHLASENNWTTLDASFKNAVLHYTAEVRNDAHAERQATLSVHLKDADGRIIASREQTVTLSAGKTEPLDFEFVVHDAHLWTSETPYLYTVESMLQSNGDSISPKPLKVGLRQIKINGNRLIVNGLPVKLMAVNRHEIHPLRGRSLTPELCREDALLFKAANVNTIRTSHYPPSEEFLEACDEIGLFVECEAAVCWIEHHASPIWKKWDYLNARYFPYFLRPGLEMLAAYRNHPSILFWSLANESKWSPLWAKVLQVFKRYEQTRPCAFHDQCWGGFNNAHSKADIANYHYPSENNSDAWSKKGRPVWFGEYAHLQCYNRRELATDPGIQEDWSRPLQRMVDLMWEEPGCLGGAIWNGIDDVFHLPDGNLCGYGHWGVIDAWRREKPEYHGLKMAYTPFRVFSLRAEEGLPLRLFVQNRQNFLNLKDNRIIWESGSKSGELKAELAPHAKGELRADIPLKTGEKLTVTVKDPQGREIARETAVVGGSAGEIEKKDRSNTKSLPVGVHADKALLVLEQGLTIPLPVPMVLALNGEGGINGPAGTTLSNEVDAFTPIGDWTWMRDMSRNDEIAFTGRGKLGTGLLKLVPQKDGRMLIRYMVKINEDINPRQWGLVFTLPHSFDTISWNRQSHWSWYPEHQIGRPAGSAKANPVNRKEVEILGVKPGNVWKDDSNKLGTNDFRSTKMNIRAVSLSTSAGMALTVAPADRQARNAQSVRAWVDGKQVHVLVAGFNTGGADGFFGAHYSAERKPLKKGETICSEFIVGQETTCGLKPE